jgi:hypothetical protein
MRDVSEELGVEQEEKTVCAATVAPGLLAQVRFRAGLRLECSLHRLTSNQLRPCQ